MSTAVFMEAARRLKMPGRDEPIIIACSGGSDSAALAVLAAEAGWRRATLCHLDHGLREGSSQEAEAVAGLADSLGLDFRQASLGVTAYLKEHGGNLEETCRHLRYAELESAARDLGATAILTGHTADDRVETLWLWLLRGTGLRGLAPLPAERALHGDGNIRLLRPLLDFTREDLRELLREREISWIEDPSNDDLGLKRNLVRHRLLPFLRDELGLDPSRGAANLAEQVSLAADFLSSEASRSLKHGRDDSGFWVDRDSLAKAHRALGSWFLSSGPEGIGAGAAARILAMNAGEATGRTIELPDGLQARFGHDRLWIGKRAALPDPDDLPLASLPPNGLALPVEGRLTLTEMWELSIHQTGAGRPLPDSAMAAVFDTEKLRLPLRLANPEQGQKIRPQGGPGRRKISALAQDARVPPSSRDRIIILLDADGEALWILGLRRGEGAELSESTKTRLCLDVIRTST